MVDSEDYIMLRDLTREQENNHNIITFLVNDQIWPTAVNAVYWMQVMQNFAITVGVPCNPHLDKPLEGDQDLLRKFNGILLDALLVMDLDAETV